FSPSYSPRTKLFYVMAQDDYAQVYYKVKTPYEPGKPFEGGGARNVPGEEGFAVVKALEPESGKLRWEFKLHALATGGLLSTAGGLVFGGSREGYFFALDAESGKPLWRFQTGAQVGANPISYAIDGKQQVAVAAGQGLFAFAID